MQNRAGRKPSRHTATAHWNTGREHRSLLKMIRDQREQITPAKR